jgi:nicotinate-nucleotide pyrophosphorylase (carboxylating)
LKVTTFIQDGATVQKGDIAFIVEGKSQSITTIERLVLNVMQRMSGIATETHRLTQMIAQTNCKLLDTRKTTPNFRYFEKEAVRIGGGYNHRYALYDMILVKDNHIDFAGGVKPALSKISEFIKERNLSIKVEVETRNLEEVDEVIETGVAFRIMLDNFTPEKLREAVLHINGRVETEASGGINENTLVSYAETGVDYISMGALTHHVKSFDLSLKAIK